MFNKDLSANVPLYPQQQCVWCGAASGEMARNGYPNVADRLFYLQSDVWNAIQARNSMAPADAGWATDPHGLTACLQSLSNPPGVHWVEFADADRNTVLFDILFWMNVREYPSPVLINQGGHWVVIVGYVTDVEPVSGTSPSLQTITVHDPEPHNVGTISTFTGAQWFGGPWNGAVIYSGTWLGEYVAVVEPPIERGTVRVKPARRTGKSVLSPKKALEYARRGIADLPLDEQSRYGLLSRPDIGPLDPMLVREEPLPRPGTVELDSWARGEIPRSRAKNVPHYYIVPFGFEEERDERGSRVARVGVLVNAYTGLLEEVTAFGSPVRFLTDDEALDVVASALRTDRGELEDSEVTLMFQPSDISHIRAYPFWRIRVRNRTFFVDQLGTLYGKLLLSIPGD
jgi:hypothetical protein